VPRSNEDEAWQAIVDNYGDRAQLDPAELPAPEPAPEVATDAQAAREPEPDPFAVPAELDPRVDEDRFVPPPPPPLPQLPRDRKLAWAGLFGSPTVLLTAVVLGVSIPSLIAYLLVGAFVGGFLYLVVQMPRGPQDPWDDGARI
jgi:hypothetical protein